jgi:uncharacterized protein (TIGR02246 family)
MRDLFLSPKRSWVLKICVRCLLLLLAAELFCSATAEAQKKKKKNDTSVVEASEKSLTPLPDDRAIDLVISEMLGAWQIGDLERLHKFYADDVVVVSGAWEPPVTGWDNYAKAYQRQRERTQRVTMDRTNTLIRVLGNTSWASYQWQFSGVVDGTPMVARGQTTLVLEKQKDRWMIIHNHTSLIPEAQGMQRGQTTGTQAPQQKPPANP